MNFTTFKDSLVQASPPQGLSLSLQALWYEAKGDWPKAHQLAQQEHASEGAWVHAYLHRKEGDAGNAAYWYSRAGKAVSRSSHDEEWEEIVKALLEVARC